MKCWQDDPLDRPSFSEIVDITRRNLEGIFIVHHIENKLNVKRIFTSSQRIPWFTLKYVNFPSHSSAAQSTDATYFEIEEDIPTLQNGDSLSVTNESYFSPLQHQDGIRKEKYFTERFPTLGNSKSETDKDGYLVSVSTPSPNYQNRDKQYFLGNGVDLST